MNANELADDLGKALAEILKLQDQVRQQQAEIELLNAKLAYMFEQEIKSVRINR